MNEYSTEGGIRQKAFKRNETERRERGDRLEAPGREVPTRTQAKGGGAVASKSFATTAQECTQQQSRSAYSQPLSGLTDCCEFLLFVKRFFLSLSSTGRSVDRSFD